MRHAARGANDHAGRGVRAGRRRVAAAAVFAIVLRQIPAVPRIPDLLALSFMVAALMGERPVLEVSSALGTVLYLASVGLFAAALAVTAQRPVPRRAAIVRLGIVTGIVASLVATIPAIDSVTVAFVVLPLALFAALFVLAVTVAAATAFQRLDAVGISMHDY